MSHPTSACFRVFAPSNIALAKYMGKDDVSVNQASNPSLSMTLDSLRTWLEVEKRPSMAGKPHFELLHEAPAGLPLQAQAPQLSEKAIARFLAHATRVESRMAGLLAAVGLHAVSTQESCFTFRTANTFPAGSGIASSASSFAALTLGMAWAICADPEEFRKAWESEDRSLRRALARLSREGSGSSCRSMEGPFVRWEGDRSVAIDSKLEPMADFVLLVSSREKEVSSSQAHIRVKSSPLWDGRTSRVRERVVKLDEALAAGDLSAISKIAWSESWEMHSLFHTSEEPFSYWAPETLAILRWVSPELKKGRPWIVTLDAGPNVHILCPQAQVAELRQALASAFPALSVLEDSQGSGAGLVSWGSIV
jgi:diphosphomevalonate decarboxylase